MNESLDISRLAEMRSFSLCFVSEVKKYVIVDAANKTVFPISQLQYGCYFNSENAIPPTQNEYIIPIKILKWYSMNRASQWIVHKDNWSSIKSDIQ